MKQTSTITRKMTEDQERTAFLRRRQTDDGKTVFHVYTEDRPNLSSIVGRLFDGATIVRAVGLWQGQTEPSADIIIVGTIGDASRVRTLAEDIKRENNQSAVLITWTPTSSTLV